VAHHDPIGLIRAPMPGLPNSTSARAISFVRSSRVISRPGEPVGSRNISRLIAVPLSPASVRNVMSDLEQLGLIYAPHTSAGRLPTELGLRFFRRCLDAGWGSYRGGTANRFRISLHPSARRSKSVEASPWRSVDTVVRLDPRCGSGADREIQFAAEAHIEFVAAGAGAGAGGAGRGGRPGRESRADLAVRRSFFPRLPKPPISSTRGFEGGRWRKHASNSKPP